MEKKTYNIKEKHFKIAFMLFFVLSAFLTKAQNARTTLQSINSDKSTTQQQKDQLKKQWIENNKEEYVKMGGKLENSTPNSSNNRAPEFKVSVQQAQALMC